MSSGVLYEDNPKFMEEVKQWWEDFYYLVQYFAVVKKVAPIALDRGMSFCWVLPFTIWVLSRLLIQSNLQ